MTKQRKCRVCGCTDEAACPGGCSWADRTRTICTACTQVVEWIVGVCRDMDQGRSTDAMNAARVAVRAGRLAGRRLKSVGVELDDPIVMLTVRIAEAVTAGAWPRAYRLACKLRRRVTGRPAGSPLQRAAQRQRRKGGGA